MRPKPERAEMNGGPSNGDDEEDWGQYASPPCFMHELDPFYQLDASHPRAEDPQQERDVARWRKSERERLISTRLGLHPEERAEQDRRIACHLDAILALAPVPLVIGVYWPVAGEPDLRPWMAAAHSKGARIALPAVIEASKQQVFHAWSPGRLLSAALGAGPPRQEQPK
jgi:5-formyltetrahydrofolate cyclo-ligase